MKKSRRREKPKKIEKKKVPSSFFQQGRGTTKEEGVLFFFFNHSQRKSKKTPLLSLSLSLSLRGAITLHTFTAMGTEILQPHDCLIQRFGSVSFSLSSSCRQTYANPRPDLKKRGDPKRSPHPAAKRGGRRNDRKKAASFDDRDLTVSRIRRLEPKPAVESDVYAGSAFSQSPAPSSLPLPTFSRRRETVDDLATNDLRRLLRIG